MLNKMLERALSAKKTAYAPYSKFHVGAVILSENNNLYSGCNIENAAYPQGCCAEMTAIGHMIMGGDKTIKEILVVGGNEDMCTPCGGCRQKIREFANKHTLIHCANSNGVLKTFTLNELLPYSFGPEDLGK